VWIPVAASAQVEAASEAKQETPPFYLDALSFLGDTAGSRLDVYIQVPYSQLHFLKDRDQYVARYEATVTILSDLKTPVVEKNWIETVRTTNFDETISTKAYSLVVRSFPLQASKYTLRAQVRDAESRKISQIEIPVHVPNFSKSDLTVSDLMLVKRLSVDGGRKNVTPNITANVTEEPGPFHLFFELYNNGDFDSLQLDCKVFSPVDKKLEYLAASQVEPVTHGRNQVFLRIDTLDLPLGNYDLVLEVRKPVARTGEAPTLLATTKRFIMARWVGIPMSVTDLDAAIDQLIYIAKDSERKYLKEATSLREKQDRFMEFWKKRDPTPGTEENEAMEEYYARVEYANQHFKHYLEGWKTDRGMIFIIFGAPSNVDRHPFEIGGKPYEVWYYYDQDRRFVFVDQTGFGDYRLITPLSEVWKRR